MSGDNMAIRLAFFDMDGTIFESYMDWSSIKKELDLENRNILREIYQVQQVDHHRLKLLEKHEKENTLKTQPIPGIREFITFLKQQGLKLALITNNNKANTDYLLEKFQLEFHEVVTREAKLWKPNPDAFLYMMEVFSCSPEETISIGDSHYDIKASKRANIANIFIKSDILNNGETVDDVVYFQHYFELKKIIEYRFFL
jgi:HAD superfamily hydrolase (TIGR01509 family)